MISIKSFGKEDIIESLYFVGSLGSFLDQFNSEWRSLVVQPVIISVNDNQVFPNDWDKVVVSANDHVEIIILPFGGVMRGIGKIFSSVFKFAFGWLMPKGNKGLGQRQTQQGQQIGRSELKANTPRIGSVVPEIFGRYRCFPDYITEPRRYFVNKRQQEVSALLCVGVGSYKIEDVKTGDSMFSDLTNSNFKQFNPNQDVEKYAEAWHTVAEIGSTSSGTAGLELLVTEASAEVMKNTPSVGGYEFSGNKGLILTRVDGTSFNENYSKGVNLTVARGHLYLARKTQVYQPGIGIIQDTLELVGFVGHIGENDNLGSLEGYDAYVYQRNSDGTGIIRFINKIIKMFLPYSSQNKYTAGESYNIAYKTVWKINSVNDDRLTFDSKDNLYFETGIDADAVIDYHSGGRDRPSYTNKFSATPHGVKTDEIELDFFFDQGLCWIDDNGNVLYTGVNIQIEISDKNTGSVVLSVNKSYAEATNDQIGFTERIKLPYAMEALVRVRRLEKGLGFIQIHDNITWFGLKSRLPDVRVYKDWTTLGVTLRSGGRISAQSENSINLIATRILPELQADGSWSDQKPTRHISAFTRYIAEQIGYTLDDIDTEELLRLNNTYWNPRKEYFDYIFDETTVKDAIDLAFNAGMSSLTIENGKIKPVRDDKRTMLEQSYSAQNIIGALTQSFRLKRIDDYDGVEVEYTDPDTFDKKVVECLLPGSQGFKLRKISINGVTDKNRSYIIGMREASADRYRNRDFSFKTEMDAFNSQYMSYIAVIDDIPNFGQSTIVKNVNGNIVTLSDDILGDPDVFSFRDRKGSLKGPYKIVSFDKNIVTVGFDADKPIVDLNYELPHAYLGTNERWAHKCLVTDISPNGIDSATITAVNYDERIYNYDNTELYK